ncbi:MAG: hypothetical protein RLZZ450_1792 [Pseudomonadota bacterium]|jgi:uncharacterized protein (TIGR03382 family)
MVRSVCTPLAACLVLLVLRTPVQAEVRSVDPGKTFAAPCAAFASAVDGDTIEIDAAGSYVGDVCAMLRNNLTIKGVNGRPHIAAGGKNSGGKATWVIQGRDTTVDNVELSGSHVPDKNGAGIRQEGRNLTVKRSYFHDNENGILGGADAESVYVVEDSEFANNGAGDGQSHNLYIGEIKSEGASGSPAVRSNDSGGCSSTPTPNSQIWGSFMMLMLAAVALRRRFK